jgi:hypothetical protein
MTRFVVRPWMFFALSAISLGAYFVLAWLGMPGEPSACFEQGCWCEHPRDGIVREPYNTWSNLPVFAVAILMARFIDDRRVAGPDVIYDRSFIVAFSYALWIQASGAFYFHGSLLEWTRIFDAGSVLCVWGTVMTTSVIRMGFLHNKYLAHGIVLTSTFAFTYRAVGGNIDWVGSACLLVALVFEATMAWRCRKVSPLLFGAFVSLIVSLVFWNLAKPGGTLCGVFPGHALWHLGMGCTVGLLALHAARDACEKTSLGSRLARME